MSDDGIKSVSARMCDTVAKVIDAINAMDGELLRPLLADDAVMELPFAPPGIPGQTSGANDMAAGPDGGTV